MSLSRAYEPGFGEQSSARGGQAAPVWGQGSEGDGLGCGAWLDAACLEGRNGRCPDHECPRPREAVQKVQRCLTVRRTEAPLCRLSQHSSGMGDRRRGSTHDPNPKKLPDQGGLLGCRSLVPALTGSQVCGCAPVTDIMGWPDNCTRCTGTQMAWGWGWMGGGPGDANQGSSPPVWCTSSPQHNHVWVCSEYSTQALNLGILVPTHLGCTVPPNMVRPNFSPLYPRM